MRNNILLVWELIPEQSKIFRLLDLDDETYRKLLKCHGHIGNTTDCDKEVDSIICDWLCGYLEDKGEWLLSNLGEDIDPMSEYLDDYRLVHCGFAL